MADLAHILPNSGLIGKPGTASGTFATDGGWIDGMTASAVEGMIVRP
jgi:hypothetical protein